MRVLYFGTPEFAVGPLRALIEDARYTVPLVISQPDKAAGRGKKLSPPPVKKCAQEADIAVVQPKSLKKEWSSNLIQEALTAAGPIDIGVVCAFGQILPVEVLTFPTHGCVNIHASILPRWRGAAPIHRAIMAGDRETGITLMQMDEGLDTGDWYIKSTIPIGEETVTGELHDSLAALGSSLIVEHLIDIASGKLSPHKQDDSLATYAKKVEKGEALIDWTNECTTLSNHIRGLNPYPGAYTTFMGKRLKIFSVRIAPEFQGENSTDSTRSPGTVYHIDDSRLEICCGDGVLSLLEVQLEGKGRMKIREFLKGQEIAADSVFGDEKLGKREKMIIEPQAGTPIIAASILAADIAYLAHEVQDVVSGGSDWLHLDVMDGTFVPPITFGGNVVKALKTNVDHFLDVHLMIDKPEKHVEHFIESGAHLVTIHVEATEVLGETLKIIRAKGARAGVAINPETPVGAIESVLDLIDLALVMTVNPGWGGQAFMPECLPKIEELAKLRKERNLPYVIEVDGGINPETARKCFSAGADVFVAGSNIFKAKERKVAIEALKSAFATNVN